MRIALFCHSLISDWNHGNAHFLRGIASELIAQHHDLDIYEPSDGWSIRNLETEHGDSFHEHFRRAFPHLKSQMYDVDVFDFERALRDVQLVIVHEWNDARLINTIASLRCKMNTFVALFHDTHHRLATIPEEIQKFDLRSYDAVLTFGESLAELYRESELAKQVFVWHEAADARIFQPSTAACKTGEIVWIGNWGDEERTNELFEYFIEPVRTLGLKAAAYGVRYPEQALKAMKSAGIDYHGWLPNYQIPNVFSRFYITLHVPRGPYVHQLPGIPTIRVFEALSCEIPLICAPWTDSERLFRANDFLLAVDGADMKRKIRRLLDNSRDAKTMASNGRRTILERHTCKHRVSELMTIYRQLTSCLNSLHCKPNET
jgi:spore maturation protein CgeB